MNIKQDSEKEHGDEGDLIVINGENMNLWNRVVDENRSSSLFLFQGDI